MLLTIDRFFVATAVHSTLKIYSLEETLIEEFYKKYDSSISALYATNDFLLVGLFNGQVFLLHYKDKTEHLLVKHDSKVTCFSNNGNFYYIGFEEGIIVVLYINTSTIQQSDLSSSVFYDESSVSEVFSSNDLAINFSMNKKNFTQIASRFNL
ncbi:hypothetical protein EDEG_02613 [Edhazardia aedis USNM 41457]|uniref:Anaphase-promoting complex subunit 4 WD40 domain-containing protein n=1 Tax=Edhazardia aedis (strain USNM 41457) TaxID=1003232 RepID=J9D600_EDHAE|nr:hypothetical protein EDEG_02613 [Edhazardia aedis USNM 41457]|eukprot:EJW02969.1 hypothetical protein EDEG_02613 [Edhazardia aedis USNM 41457]